MNTLNFIQIIHTTRFRLPFQKKMICLTFDDGHKFTDQILDKLEMHKQKATFFLCGSYIETNLSIYKKIFKLGHEIGNHSYTHPHLTALSNCEIITELSKTQQLINEITENNSSMLFRFPYGASTDSLAQFVRTQGYTPVRWTIDSRDWTGISATDIYQNIIHSKCLKNGAIILMHTSGAHTAEALDLIIPMLQKRNFKMITISALLQYGFKV